MSTVFYTGQTDYIAKLNVLGDSITDNTVSATTAATTLNFQLGANHLVTISTASTTFTFSNVPTGPAGGYAYRAVIILRQDGTGSRTVTWPPAVKWPNATAPVLTTTANRYDVFELITFDSGTSWFGTTLGLNYT